MIWSSLLLLEVGEKGKRREGGGIRRKIIMTSEQIDQIQGKVRRLFLLRMTRQGAAEIVPSGDVSLF